MARFYSAALIAVCGSCVALPVAAQQQNQAAAPGDFPRFDSVDANLNGMISRTEFTSALPQVDNPDQLFAAADANDDGQISRQEWGDWQAQRLGTTGDAEPEEVTRFGEPAIELQFTDDVFQGYYFTDGDLVGFDDSRLGFGVLFSDQQDIVGSAELMTPGLLERFLPDFVSLNLGARTYLALLDDPEDELAAIAPGAQARVQIPFLEDVPIAGVGEVYFAPDILTFGDAERLLDFNGRVEVEALENTIAYVGIRVLNFEREEDDADDTLIDGIMGGVRFTF